MYSMSFFENKGVVIRLNVVHSQCFPVSRDDTQGKPYTTLHPRLLPLSYPVGSCIRNIHCNLQIKLFFLCFI